ncbi:MAG: HRDC domain-containing protein [Chloroflexota bacterium]
MSRFATASNRILKQLFWIHHSLQLEDLVKTLSQEPVVAVDTESDSLYSYFEKVCLIQFSTPQADYLLDPLRVDVASLASIFADPAIQKVFHAAEYDILSLKRDYGFTFRNLFDTMIAARILGWSRYGLGHILEQHFQVKLDKRFQRYNWGTRPLSGQALNYARLDTHYLLDLRDIQLAELTRQKRLREAQEAFERQTHVESSPKIFDPDDFWRIKGARDLAAQQQAVLRELFILRDKIARRIDRPPFKIMTDITLLRLAKEQPRYASQLEGIKGIGEKLLQHNCADILSAIRAGQNAPLPQYQQPNNHAPDEQTLTRYETLRQWRNDLAAQRGVEPDVIMSNNSLMAIARHNPKSLADLTQMGVLGNWQFETYGKTLLRVLKSMS